MIQIVPSYPPTNRENQSGAMEESGARGPCPVVSGVNQTGLMPRISRYGRVIKKPLRFRETTDSKPV